MYISLSPAILALTINWVTTHPEIVPRHPATYIPTLDTGSRFYSQGFRKICTSVLGCSGTVGPVTIRLGRTLKEPITINLPNSVLSFANSEVAAEPHPGSQRRAEGGLYNVYVGLSKEQKIIP